MKKHTVIITPYLLIAILLISCNDTEGDIQYKHRITLDHVEVLYNVLPSGNYTALSFTSENTAFTITNFGDIFKTEDRGNTWTQQNSGTELNLHNMYFLNDLHGYIVGGDADGIILKTTDGGSTWTSIDFQVGLSAIHFINETIGFVSGQKLFVTKDGGETWEEVDLGYNTYRNLNFFDEESGFLIADNTLLSTSDGGMNWITINNKLLENYSFKKILIFNNTACLLSNETKIFLTQDKGITWSVVDFTFLNSIYFINILQAIGVGQHWYDLGYYSNGKLCVTNDGGRKWEEMYFPANEFMSINSIDFSNDSTAIAVGNSPQGCIIKLSF